MTTEPTHRVPTSGTVPDPQARRRDQLRLGTESWQIGHFRAHPGTALFSSEEPPGHDAIVFPRRAVRIRRRGGSWMLASPSKVILHGASSAYRRAPIDPEGDECVWYWLAPEVRDEIAHALPARSRRGLSEAEARCPGPLFAAERALWAYVKNRPWEPDGEPDWLMVEEAVLTVARDALRATSRARGSSVEQAASLSRFNVERADAYLAAHFHRGPTLDDIAAAARCSKFHLARLYRLHRGRTLHAARTELQLRAAYDLVTTTERPMTDIALDVGFSSPSHFSTRFQRAFGRTPSTVRRRSGTSPRRPGG